MKKKSEYLPLALKVSGKKLLVVGGGEVALKRFEQWSERGAEILLVAAAFCPAFARRLQDSPEGTTWQERPFQASDLEGCALVYAATSDGETNAAIEALCRARGIWCGRADSPQPEILGMALIESERVQVAISTSGRSPGISRMIREQLEAALDLEALERRIDVLDQLKDKLRSDVADQPHRASLLRQALLLPIADIERLLSDEAVYSRFKG